MQNQIQINGYHNFNNKGEQAWTPKLIKKNLEYGDLEIEGYGQPVTTDMFIHMMNLYKDFIENGDIAEIRKLMVLSINVTFGRESLLLLLLQKGCTGISFFWGINDQKPEKRLTLLASASFFDPVEKRARILQYQKILDRIDADARFDVSALEEFDTSDEPLIIEVVPDGKEMMVNWTIPDII